MEQQAISSKNHKRGRLILIVLGLIVVGFFRDYLFKSFNSQMYYIWYKDKFDYSQAKVSWLEGLDYWTMFYLKFPLTALFVVVYFFFSVFTVRTLFPKNSEYINITKWLFVIIGTVSLILFGVGYVVGMKNEFYILARFLVDFIQSPFLLMMLVPAFMLSRRVG